MTSIRMELRRHELLADVAAHGAVILKKYGLSGEHAEAAAIDIADHLAQNWGGQMICIPTNYRFQRAQKEREIFAKFTGSNYADLAKEYGVTERGMRKLIARVIEKNRQARKD